MSLPPFWKCGLPCKRVGARRLDVFGPKGDELGGNSGWVGRPQSHAPVLGKALSSSVRS